MNASARTTSIARGLAIYAEWMDCPAQLSPEQARLKDRWDDWAAAHGRAMVDLVYKTHNQIFETLLRV